MHWNQIIDKDRAAITTPEIVSRKSKLSICSSILKILYIPYIIAILFFAYHFSSLVNLKLEQYFISETFDYSSMNGSLSILVPFIIAMLQIYLYHSLHSMIRNEISEFDEIDDSTKTKALEYGCKDSSVQNYLYKVTCQRKLTHGEYKAIQRRVGD